MNSLNRIVHRRPIAGLTAKQAASTLTFQRARSQGYGIADAVAQARSSDASRRSAAIIRHQIECEAE
jgi:hypothetical protein